MADFKGLRSYFLVFLSLFSFSFRHTLGRGSPSPDAFYVNFRGSSFEHDVDFA